MPKKKKQSVIDEEKIETIRTDLKTQLLNQGKMGKHFDRYETMTGNGYLTEKENKSPDTLIKTNNQMLKILQVLDLKEPEELPKVGDGKGDLL